MLGRWRPPEGQRPPDEVDFVDQPDVRERSRPCWANTRSAAGLGGLLPTSCRLPRLGARRAHRRCPSWAGFARPAGRSARPWSGPHSGRGPSHVPAGPSGARSCEPPGPRPARPARPAQPARRRPARTTRPARAASFPAPCVQSPAALSATPLASLAGELYCLVMLRMSHLQGVRTGVLKTASTR